ncbi:MAG: nucleoside-diphosphate sugar epimerase/dehydratase [Oscillospiraceae bacterium]|nr:nucleoside-diphosphate sugar epimerase/dehydratase [Oscillospiraceae bacterium]
MKVKKKNEGRRHFHLEQWHVIAFFLVIYDVVVINASYFLALWVRFDGEFSNIPAYYLDPYTKFAPIYTVICLVVFVAMRLYQSVWRFASFDELMRIAVSSILVSIIHTVLITVIFYRMPISYYVWGACLQLLFLVASRFSQRVILAELNKFKTMSDGDQTSRIMIIGAGNAGQVILRSIEKETGGKNKVVCFIDDNTNKHNRYIQGVPVVGGRNDILYNVDKYKVHKIFIAMPNASREAVRDIINICSETDCELKNLPSLYNYLNGDFSINQMKDISADDLLGREPVKADMREVYEFIRGKTILVTGGGGSIGSELCRQVARHDPERLIIFDIYENNAYAIQQELHDAYPDLQLEVLIGSVRDSRRLDDVFRTYRPDIVYHAAAHKHVPLMEDSPCEAIKNNVLGTYKTAYAAMIHGCKRFVLISTDKAVNPTNIMGASKHLCEMIINSFDRKIKENRPMEIPRMFTHMEDPEYAKKYEGKVIDNVQTEFVAVRFGNVLSSNGSVVPIFKRQIERGGPVTVTHPDIIRYFMTIPEAVSLVLYAGAYAKGGEIFVLDMGSPVKIDTLARNLIRLSGHKPDVDIKIEYTGLRPGEKLYEEMLMAEEGLTKTPNKLVFIGNPIPFDVDVFQKQIEQLMLSAYDNNSDIKQMVKEIVPEYVPMN